MKRKKRGSYPGIQIGTSYLLVIFVILCLVTFATLSLSSAKGIRVIVSSLPIGKRRIVKQMQRRRRSWRRSMMHLQKRILYLQFGRLRVTAEEDGANLDISYVVPVTDSQNLEVEILADSVKGTHKVVKWKESASEKWEEKSTLPVLGSD